MRLKIIGTIDLIRPVEHRGKFKKCEFSIFTKEKKYYGLTANNNDAYWLTDYKQGDIVEIDFELQGKPWGGKVYNNLVVQKITTISDQGSKDYAQAKKAIKEMKRKKPQPIKINIHSKD